MYLKHLLVNGKVPVIDPVSREIAFSESEAAIAALVAAGRIRVVKRRKVKALYWVGPSLGQNGHSSIHPREAVITSDLRSQTRYSHKHETAQNPPNVWTFVPLRASFLSLFLAVVNDCGGMRVIPRKRKSGARNQKKA